MSCWIQLLSSKEYLTVLFARQSWPSLVYFSSHWFSQIIHVSLGVGNFGIKYYYSLVWSSLTITSSKRIIMETLMVYCKDLAKFQKQKCKEVIPWCSMPCFKTLKKKCKFGFIQKHPTNMMKIYKYDIQMYRDTLWCIQCFLFNFKDFFLYVSDKTLFLLQTDSFLIDSFHYLTPHDRYKGDCIIYLSKVWCDTQSDGVYF